MRLELGSFQVRDVVFSDRTMFHDGVLSVNKTELLDYLSKDSPFKTIEIDIARPGEETRIVHALDIVEPRTKISGPGCVFPGFLGPPLTVGKGRTTSGLSRRRTSLIPFNVRAAPASCLMESSTARRCQR